MSTVELRFNGGLGEVGRNMTTIAHGESQMIVDCGVLFPSATDHGIDLILPAWDAAELDDRLDAIFLTHGHLDHIAALPLLLEQLDRRPRIFGSELTLAIARHKLEENGISLDAYPVDVLVPGDEVSHGDFRVEALPVTHSIPGAFSYLIEVGGRRILHTGDFKTGPGTGVWSTDLGDVARVAADGIDLALIDSTNAEFPGTEPSEPTVATALEVEVRRTTGLVVATTFASHIDRIAQLVRIAKETDRLPVLVGRSMQRNAEIACELGLLPAELVFDLNTVDHVPDENLLLICTGSQGEAFSALGRLSRDEFHNIRLGAGDTVLITASIIPGNENEVFEVVNKLSESGARVCYRDTHDIHVSGHARAGELQTYLSVVRPNHVIPVHGEARHLMALGDIARTNGIEPGNVHYVLSGDAVALDGDTLAQIDSTRPNFPHVAGGRYSTGTQAVRERRKLAERGVVSVHMTRDASGALADVAISTYGVADDGDGSFAEVLSARLREQFEPSWLQEGKLQGRVQQVVSTESRRHVGQKPVAMVTMTRGSAPTPTPKPGADGCCE